MSKTVNRSMVLLLLVAHTVMVQPAWAQQSIPTTVTEPTEIVELDPVTLVRDPIKFAQTQPDGVNQPGPLVATQPSVPLILTTRPSFTDSWLAIPQGSFQVENGVTYTDNSDRTRSVILPESLLKLGITDDTEIRFSVPNYTYWHHDDDGRLANNFGDITAGISHHIALPGKVDLAIIPFLNIPTGANVISSNSLDPQLRLVGAKWLTSKLVVASQFDARWNTGKNAAAAVVMNPTGIAYYSFTDKLSGFMEYGGFIPTTGKSTHYVQGGALYLLTNRQQIDVRIATGLNRASSDLILGMGYSFRVDGLFGKSRDYASFPKLRK